jgi:hypothetical protein
MARIFNEQETQAIFEAEKVLRSKGLIVDEADGKAEYAQNCERISSYLELNSQIPVTVEMILLGCEQMREQMCWKSKAQMEYDAAYGSLTTDQKNSFGAWWFTSGKKYVEIDGDRGFENATKIITWCKGRSFTPTTFDLAVSNLASSQGLHFQTVKAQPNPRQHSDSGGFMPKQDTNLSARDHARKAQQARAESTLAPSSTNQEPDAWKTLCQQLLNHGSHSCQENMRRVFEAKGEKSWRELYKDMDRVKKSYEVLFSYRY